MNAEYYIRKLKLEPHPEGGFYRQTYRSTEEIPVSGLPGRFMQNRPMCTAIYYLLQENDFSAFHRIKSDECWHFYAGGTLFVHVIEQRGNYSCISLGNNIENGELLQFVVPAGAWFAVEPAPTIAFALTGCTVSPGFDFEDFEMGNKKDLISAFPEHERVVSRLCRQ
jgi:uncharacterized protein